LLLNSMQEFWDAIVIYGSFTESWRCKNQKW
jgi:hypothetical protein